MGVGAGVAVAVGSQFVPDNIQLYTDIGLLLGGAAAAVMLPKYNQIGCAVATVGAIRVLRRVSPGLAEGRTQIAAGRPARSTRQIVPGRSRVIDASSGRLMAA